MQSIHFVTTGGTIDKVYFDASSEFEVGESVVEHILREALVGFDTDVTSLMRKDSLELTDADRAAIREHIAHHPGRLFVVTHGTDTMVETGKALDGIAGKVIVLTGSLTPARFKATDAVFNIGLAVGAVQSLPHGVYIAMSGQIFKPEQVQKNKARNRFETITAAQP